MADIKKLLESFDRIGEDKAKIKAPAPRNVVAKNAKTSGAGQHKNPREIENTRKEKHKKDFLKDLHEAEKDTRILRRIEEAYSKFKEAKMHISPSGVKTNMDPSDDDYAINYGKNGLVAKHRKELGLDVETGEKKDVAEGFEKFQVGDKISFPLSQMATGIVDKIDDKRLYVKLDNGEVYTIPSTMLHSVKLLERQGVAEGSNQAGVVVKISGREYAAMSPEQKAAKQREWQQLKQQAKKRLQTFTVVDTDKEQGVAEAEGQQLSVQQLAMISDEALDNAYGYGRSSPGNTFGWQANLMSAAYAKKMIDAGITDIEQISDAIHKGWNVTAQKFVQDPDQFDDTEKLRQAGKLDAKLQQRAKLMKINYSQLDNEEQEKDRVVARALLQAIRGDQGVTEELKMKKQQEFYGKNQRLPDTSTSLAKRSIGWPEVPNVPRTDDGTPTVQHRFHGKGVHTRLDPRPEQTSVQRKDASIEKPIPAFLQKGMAETSDVSGLLAASKLNNSYIITAELAEGGTKKFRVKAQSEQVALEKFKKHYAMAKVIDVTPEVQEATTMPTSPTAPTSATSTTTTSATQQKPLNLQAVQQQLKIPGNPMPGGTASADNVQSMAVQAVIQKALAGKPLDSAENNLYHSILQKANK